MGGKPKEAIGEKFRAAVQEIYYILKNYLHVSEGKGKGKVK